MAETASEAPADARDALEPAGVATGRVWLAVGAVFALLACSLGAVLLFTTHFLHGAVAARARPFAAPALETSVAPRRVPDRGPGPGAFRELPADERPARLGDPDPRLLAAERSVAARGAQGFDPLPPAPASADTAR